MAIPFREPSLIIGLRRSILSAMASANAPILIALGRCERNKSMHEESFLDEQLAFGQCCEQTQQIIQ